MLEHRLALVVMNMLPGIGPGRKRMLAEYFGSAEEALEAPYDELCKLPGIGSKLAQELCGWEARCQLEEELSLVRRSGAVVVTEEDDAYPPLLREIHDPPICLYVLGSLEALQKSDGSLAMVGSRMTTPYGLRQAERLAMAASRAGWTIVSGLARGIDTMSHEATLRAQGITIAVVGSGLTCLYPQENIGLARRICEQGGAVITEFPMRYRPDRHSFPMRNRIISGMSRGTLVVEAGLQSGSLITAAQAVEQGRVVFAVPGPVDSTQSQGCHALIKDGAKLVECFGDIVDEFTMLPGLKKKENETQNADKSRKTASVELQLSGLELTLWNLLEGGDRSIDELVDESGDETSNVMACLLTMELRRLIRQLPGKRVIRCEMPTA